LSDLSFIKKISLWDPTSLDCFTKDENWPYPVIKNKLLIGDWNKQVVLSKKLVNCTQNSDKKILKNINKFDIPIQIISAGKGVLIEGAKEYSEKINSKVSLSILKDAGHCFTEYGQELKLYKKNINWFLG